jgi:hypothetical protein
MVYGAEVQDNVQCAWQTGELKTKMGIMKRLVNAKIAKLIYNGHGWDVEAINGNRFVLYCRTEWKNPYDKTSYNKLAGNMKGSWEY